MTHRFILEPYKGVASRHTCPKCKQKRCFSRYTDTGNVITFSEYVGRCDHEQKCGYHFTPKDYFGQNPDKKEHLQEPTYVASKNYAPPPPASYIDETLVERSMTHYNENKLFQFLSSQFGEDESLRLIEQYRVGTANYWQGSTVFWQTDAQGRVRTGKIMLYNPATGRRIKEPHNHITWVHSIIHKEGYNLKQCFFGEHLLPKDSTKPIAIVESEKSALIACYYLPQYLWIASGGKNGCFRDENLNVLKGRNVVLFPDLGATDDWSARISTMERMGIAVKLFDYLEKNATPEQRKSGFDIADFLLEMKQPQAILQSMITKNPALKLLIKELDLVLVEEPDKPISKVKRRSMKL
ncbi:MAG: DUF6371 domain-containing protein [Mediterranea sp.]|nr:DUF6371 domain-containing protein [Mediterranea sp.]